MSQAADMPDRRDMADELLQQSLLQLISYHAQQAKTSTMMRDQLVYLASVFGAQPKHLAAAADLTTARIQQVLKKEEKGATLQLMQERVRPAVPWGRER